MQKGARHQRSRPRRRQARRALGPLCLLLALPAGPIGAVPGDGCADGDGRWISRVCYSDGGTPPGYGHDILGGVPEWTALTVFYGSRARAASDGRRGADTILFRDGFFEDIAPRLADLDGDGNAEIIVVQTDFGKGARLAVIGVTPELRLVAATRFIGRRFRWLAPVGAADLDGDGRVEIAYVETPHLGKTLKIVRLEGDRLVPVAEARGLTNHVIGDPFIQGRIAACAGRPTILTANADWTRITATTLAAGRLTSRDIGPYRGPDGFDHVAGCD